MQSKIVGLVTVLVAGCNGLRVGPPPPTIRPTYAPATPAADDTRVAAVVAGGMALLAVVEPAAASDVSWVAPTKLVLTPLLSLGTLAFLMRTVLSWFPKYNLNELPWSIVAVPTEPILKVTRLVVPPVAGVDISPIVWVSILSFFSEILTGPQGLLTILQKNGSL